GANPPPTLYRVTRKIEDDGDAKAQQFDRERPDQSAPSRGCPLEVIVRPDLETERIDPLIFADHHRWERSPQLAGQRRLSCSRLSADEVKRGHVASYRPSRLDMVYRG